MGDSTQPTVAARSSAATIRRPLTLPGRDRRCAAACRAIVEVARAEGLDLAERQVERAPDAPRGQHHDTRALADVIRRTVHAMLESGVTNALPTAADARSLQLLGARCGSGSFTLVEVTREVEICTAEVSSLVMQRVRDLVMRYSPATLADAATTLCTTADVVAHWTMDMLARGYGAAICWREPDADTVDATCRALAMGVDAPVIDRDDLDGLRSVAVLCAQGQRDAVRRLEIAAHDAAVLIPTAIDAGMATDPLHRRVVFSGWSRHTWREAADMLTEIGARYRLAVRTTVPAPGLHRAGAAYRVLLEGIPRNAARAARPGRITTAAATA